VADFYATLNLVAAERADVHTLEGLLHLERGATDAAGEQFAEALRVYGAEAGAAPVRPGRPLAERYLAAIREAER
jgi:hypothetical protein